MRHHLILRVVTKFLLGVIFLFALYVQFHGEYSPGGGFQAGVIMAIGFIVYGLIFSLKKAQQIFEIPILITSWFILIRSPERAAKDFPIEVVSMTQMRATANATFARLPISTKLKLGKVKCQSLKVRGSSQCMSLVVQMFPNVFLKASS